MARALPRPVQMPWGNGRVVEEVSVTTEHHEPTIQLIEWDDGGESLRFCQYWLDGRFQRQPLLMSTENLPALREAIGAAPRIQAHLRALLG